MLELAAIEKLPTDDVPQSWVKALKPSYIALMMFLASLSWVCLRNWWLGDAATGRVQSLVVADLCFASVAALLLYILLRAHASALAAPSPEDLAGTAARQTFEEDQRFFPQNSQPSEAQAGVHLGLQQSIFECAPDGIVLVDLTRNFTNINPAFTRQFGYTLSELAGKHARCIYATQEDCDLVAAHIAAGKDGPLARPLTCMRKGGEVFPVQMTGAKLRGPTGDIIGYIGIYRDISQERAREQALLEKQRLGALGRLAGGIAHDFNNLLTVISGNVQLIELKNTDDKIKGHLTEVNRAAEVGARLNQRLMTFAQQRELEPVLLDLHGVIESVENLIQRSIGDKIQLTTHLAADPPIVCVDLIELENALLNLALNASEAMVEEGIIRLETRNCEISSETSEFFGNLRPGRYIQISVSDSGIGMSAEVSSQAFEPFFTTKKESKAAGLGLTTMHGFVAQSEGHVSLQSKLGHGTTIDIYLPAHNGADLPPVKSLPVGASFAGRGEIILVVEDQPAVRSITCERLEVLGYVVVEAETAAGALAYLSEGRRVDLVFSDVIMPGGMSGYDLAKRLQLDHPEIKILLTSGFPGNLSDSSRTDKKTPCLLRKPYAQRELSYAIATALA